MTSSKVPSRVPKENSDSTSEPGLAEWTNKIKAMQRQVDADDEAEQMRLEQEIAASRLARKRRSQGFGSASRISLDVDSIASSESEALQTPSKLPTTTTLPLELARSRTKSSSSNDKPQPMSLAAFMGGNATGPRLRKHAPQQDAHDPTQFDQRAFDRTPHPAFGKGGVALPGIAVQRDGAMKPSAIAALAKAKLTSTSPEPTLVPRDNLETYQKQSPVIHSSDAQERSTSSLSPSPSMPRSTIKSASYNQENKCEPARMSTPAQDHTARVHSVSPAFSRSTTVPPTKSSRFPMDETPSPSRSVYTAPPLAGPIRPQPRPSVGPQVFPSIAPSKAFTRQPVKKDLTPSLSRLQGRGFVQSMVRVSSQVESPPIAGPETPEKSTPGRRTSSVLDRWQPNVSQNTPSPSPAPPAVRRSTTFGTSKDNIPQSPLKDLERRNLREVASQPSLRQEGVATRLRSSSKSTGAEKRPAAGLGSATTLVVYKPTPVDTPSIDEFGVKPASRGAILDFPPHSKPLSHPTKERARKPQKRTVSNAPTNPAKNPRSSLDAPQVSAEVSVIAGNLPVPSIIPTSNEMIIPRPQESQPCQVIEHGNQLSRTDKDDLRQNLSDLLNSKPINTSKPGIKQVTHSSDAPRLVRHALPGLSVPQVERNNSSSKTIVSHVQTPESPLHGSAQRALPELRTSNDNVDKVMAADRYLPQSPVLEKKEELAGITPSAKPPRIPATGDRPSTMNVAPSFNESRNAKYVEQSVELLEPGDSTQLRSSPGHMEKLRSSCEKYSSIILPPVKEEVTPAPSPTATISRKDADFGLHDGHLGRKKAKSFSEISGILSLAVSQVSVNNPPSIQVTVLPRVDFDSLLKYNLQHHYDPGTTTISVEVMSITGTTASSLTRHQTIFYDTELLAIVHRSKSQSSGLVSTSVWGWEGRRAVLGAREQRKLEEIAQRHGTSVTVVQQDSEPPQLVHILGGVLVVRQGSRAHWTPENNTMHLVRSFGGVVYVDEKDLSIKNLCSGYSYCISILDSVYVWYGRGSTPLEKKAALDYGHSLATASPPIELTEDSSKDDEMFWMILGDGEYADADFWKWRRNSSHIDPRIWRVRADLDKDCVTVVDCISSEASFHESVYIIDCIWEFYVVVGSDARSHKQDIELAINVAIELSIRVSSTRPYAPTVHALILPSQLPRDLKLVFRDLDEYSVNKGEIPDHMNVLSSTEAYKHLVTTIWDEYALRDPTLLPLGVDVSY